MAFLTLSRLAASSLFAISASGCVATPFYGKPMTDRIVKDAAAFNTAYAEASNAQILTNILYSRDRLPRQYAGFKDITTTQSRQVGGSLGIGSIPLGNPASSPGGTDDATRDAKLWGIGSLGATGSAGSSPNYGLSPLVGEQLSTAALSPTPYETFIHYWNEGWPADVLLGVFVSSAVKLEEKCGSKSEAEKFAALEDPHEYLALSKAIGPSLKIVSVKNCGPFKISTATGTTYRNDASSVSDETGEGAKFFKFAREANKCKKACIVERVKLGDKLPITTTIQIKPSTTDSFSAEEWSQIADGVEAAKAAGLSASLQKGNYSGAGKFEITLSASDPRQQFLILNKSVGEDAGRYMLILRSFDQAVYYLGELLRSDCRPDCAQLGGQKIVRAADDGEKDVPLFRVYRRDTLLGGDPDQDNAYGDDVAWAAKVSYRGAWYFAGAPQGMHVAEDPKEFDRTSTVLTLLGQVFELNRKPESLRLPAQLNN